MKKSISMLLSGIFAVLTFFSCSPEEEIIPVEANIVGVWIVESTHVMISGKPLEEYVEDEVASLSDSYDEQESEEYATYLTADLYSASVVVGSTFEFKEDNTVIVVEDDQIETGTWSITGNNVIVTFEDGMPRTLQFRSISSSQASIYAKYDEEAVHSRRGIDVTMEWKK